MGKIVVAFPAKDVQLHYHAPSVISDVCPIATLVYESNWNYTIINIIIIIYYYCH